MSAEQIVRDLFDAFNTGGPTRAEGYLADNLVVSNFMPGMPDMGKRDFVDQNQVIWQAFSNWKFTLDSVKTNGDQATVQLHVTGTHTKPLVLPLPGMPPIPPTGTNISVPDRIVITVNGDQVTAMRFESPADGGPSALLGQLGIQPPAG